MAKKKNSKPEGQKDPTGDDVVFPGLTPKQVLAVLHVADGASDAEVAELVGVDRTTVWRWRQLETFEAALNVVQLRAVEEMHRGYLARVPKAFNTLDSLLSSDSDSVRLRAVREIFTRAAETEIGFQDAASIVRRDARRVHPELGLDDLALFHLLRPDPRKPEDDSELGQQRHEYYLERLKKLGIDID